MIVLAEKIFQYVTQVVGRQSTVIGGMKDAAIWIVQKHETAGETVPSYLCTPPNTISALANDILEKIQQKPLVRVPEKSLIKTASSRLKNVLEATAKAVTPEAPKGLPPIGVNSPAGRAIRQESESAATPVPYKVDTSSPARLYASKSVLILTYVFLNLLFPKRLAWGLSQLDQHVVIPCEVLALSATLVSSA